MKCQILFSGKNKKKWRQFAINLKSCFVGKLRKISSFCCLLTLPFECLRLISTHYDRKMNSGDIIHNCTISFFIYLCKLICFL